MYRITKNVNGLVFLLLVFCLIGACQTEENAIEENLYAPTIEEGQSPYTEKIHQPDWVGNLKSGASDSLGRSIGIHCDVCHGTSPQAIANLKAESKTQQFHDEIRKKVQKHGNLKCAACHNAPGQIQSVAHLADQSHIEYPNVIYLCGQCHSSQFRDYQHGLHGGMNGYWDLRRGPRMRNNCVDCHDPHSPQYPQLIPVPPPRDRYFFDAPGKESTHG